MSEDVEVNENNGTAFVCVERSAVTEDDLTIPIEITSGSADCKEGLHLLCMQAVCFVLVSGTANGSKFFISGAE